MRAAPAGVSGRWTPGSLAGAGFAGSRLDAAAEVLAQIGAAYRHWSADGPGPAAEAFADRDALRGRDIVVETGSAQLRGRGAGIDDAGRLRVASGLGIVAVAAGDVTRVVR